MTYRTLFTFLFIFVSFAAESQTKTPADSTLPLIDSTVHGKFIFEKVEVEAAFPGGVTEWRRFLEKNLNPNVPVDNGAPIGKFMVMAQFVVDKEGNIKDVIALTKHGYGMEAEVVRLLKTGPKWVPAMQSGRPVNAYRKQPVTFMVEDDEINISSKENYVFYTEIENPVMITVNKVKADNLSVTISQGSIISKGNGNFIVKVSMPGKVIIQIFNAKKGNKKIGDVIFEVRPHS